MGEMRVECYAGYRADERPTRFILRGHTFEIMEVEERWDSPGAIYVRVRTQDGDYFVLRHDEPQDVWSVAFGPDARHIVSGSGDRTVKVWDARTGREELSLEGHADNASIVAFGPDGRRIVSGGDDGAVKVWDVRSGRVNVEFTGHSGVVFDVAWHPDGQRIASAGWRSSRSVSPSPMRGST